MTAASENHEHILKRTKKLKYGSEHQNGTVYLGSGAWGASPRNLDQCKPTNEDQIEKISQGEDATHVWLIDIDLKSDSIKYTAINPAG